MKKLIWLEFKLLLPVFGMILVSPFIIGALTREYLVFAACFSLMPATMLFASARSKRSAWYLNLPWSRVVISAAVFVQAVLVFAVFESLYWLVLQVRVIGNEHPAVSVETSIYLCAFPALMLLIRPLNGQPVRRTAFQARLNFKSLLVLLISTVFITAIAGVVTLPKIILRALIIPFESPLLIKCGIACAVCVLILLHCAQVISPLKSLARLKNRLLFGVYSFTGLIAVAALILVHVGSVNSWTTLESAEILGAIPTFISEARAVEFFEKSRTGARWLFDSKMATLHTLAFEDWQARTVNCKADRHCLSLSADVADLKTLSPQEAESHFQILSASIYQNLQIAEYIDCGRSYKFRTWLSRLKKDGTLNRWLESDEVQKQLIALRALTLNSSQLERVRTLAKSPDEAVRAMANTAIPDIEKPKDRAIASIERAKFCAADRDEAADFDIF